MILEDVDPEELAAEIKTLQELNLLLRKDVMALKAKLIRQAAFIDAQKQLLNENGLKLTRPAKVLPKHNWASDAAVYDDE